MANMRETRGENSPWKTWPWKVCTLTRGRAHGSSRAAMRPSPPALAVCVCRTSGRNL